MKKVAIDLGPGLTTIMGEASSLPNKPMDISKSLDLPLIRLCLRTVTASLVAGSLALPSAAAWAAPPPATDPIEAEEPQEADPEVARSRALFEHGLDAYEADDYAGAAQYWSEAHELMGRTPELSASRRVLGFDLAQAQMRAYERDHDQSRVVAAKPLLEGFVAWVDRPGHTMDEGEKQDRTRAVELLERIESESSPPIPVPAPQLAAPAAAPTQAPPPIAPSPSGTGWLIGGGLALGGGVASAIAAVAILPSGRAAEERYNAGLEANNRAEIDAAERDGRRANIGVLTSVSSAVLLCAAGVTMVAIGARRRKRHIAASAALTPSSAAASVSVRF